MSIYEFFSAPRGTKCCPVELGEPGATGNPHLYRGISARRLHQVAYWKQHPPLAIDSAALPIVFLYRHALELYLKAIVFQAAVRTINEEELKQAVPRLWKEHSLTKLVKTAEPVLTDPTHPLVWSGELHRKLLAIASEIDAIDPGSYSFRYPVTSKGTSSLPGNVFLNIFVLSEAMESAFDDARQFCHSLENKERSVFGQMKLSLHSLIHGNEGDSSLSREGGLATRAVT